MLSRRELLACLASSAVPLRGAEAMFADADRYERFMGRWSRRLAPLLIDFAAVPERGHLLDVGSGTGSLSFALAEARPQCSVHGVDPSNGYVEFARRANRFGKRIGFETGDAQQLRFDAGTFDAALALLVFNFIPRPEQALAELARVTKPGAPIAAATWDYGDGMKMLRLFWDAAKELDRAVPDEAHMRLCRRGELEALWKAGGLENVSERALEFDMRFSSFADYWDPFVRGQGPAGAFVRGLDEPRRARLRAALLQRTVAAEGAPFTLQARAWAVRGTAGRG